MSTVRDNLMNRPGYTPYCGDDTCTSLCLWPRTTWTGEQFRCPACGWLSQFDAEFIAEYKAKWNLK